MSSRDKPFRNTLPTSVSAAPGHHTHDSTDVVSSVLSTARLGSGTANSTKYLRGDGTWVTLDATAAGAAATSHVHAGADITTGTVAAARLGSGSGGSSKFLREDSTWQTIAAGGTGDVVGPASAVNANLCSFNTTTGKLIQDSGLATAAVLTLTGTQVVTNKDFTSGTNTFPTFNQSTTGSAATLTTSRTIGTLTGDVTSAGSAFNGSAANTNATTLATVNSNVGSFGSASSVATFTVNAKGLTTAAASTAIAIAASQVTSGQLAVAQGGTGQATAAAAITALTGTQTNGQYLRSNGTSAALAAIVAADVPTLNQNTTGSAAKLTTARTINGTSFDGTANITFDYRPGGTDVAIADGGTGVSTLPTGLLKGAGTSAITAATAGTDYYAPGGTDVAVADGGTGASTAAGARTNLAIRPAGWKFNLLATSSAITDPGAGNCRFFTGGGDIFLSYTDSDSRSRSGYFGNIFGLYGSFTMVVSDGTSATEMATFSSPNDNGTWMSAGSLDVAISPAVFTASAPVYVIILPFA